MNLEISLKRIIQLMSRFVTEIKGEASMGRTDLNKAAETILIPILNEIYGWNLENVNYIEDNNNHPGIDLVDKAARICVQVTATTSAEKVKHTLEQFIKHEQYLEYDRLIVFFLQEKKQSYPSATIQKIAQGKLNFDIQRDLWDYRDLLKEISNFQIERVNKVLEILETNFGDDKQIKPGQEIDWRETCQDLLEQWKGLTTNSLTKPDGVRFQLDDVFVPLGVVERKRKPRHAHSEGSPERGSELYKEKVTPISHNDFFENVLRQGQSQYSQGKRIAIIGEPGAGKTTQLQKIGDWILQETDDIPLWIPLSAMGTKELRDYLTQDWLQTAISELEVTEQHRDDLGQLLETGKVWLLLDGVDEMTVADALHHIATQMRGVWLQNVRVVLTCRLNVWEVGKNALDNFDVYRNLDFEYPDEVHQFIDKWFQEEPDLQQRLKDALEQTGKERIRDMAKNPLRLTLLCYSWLIRQGELPETKAGLYEWFVDAFYEWNKGKVPHELTSAKRHELNQALGELAGEAIDQNSSRFRLTEKFVTRFLGDAGDEGSLFNLTLQLGWLNRIGVAAENPFESVYAFLHPTFQEYFAALAICDWDFFLPRSHIHKPVRNREYRIFQFHWKEVILLWSGCKSKQGIVEELISKLISLRDSCGGYYSLQSYFMASEMTSEFNSVHTESIISSLVEWEFDYSDVDLHLIKKIELARNKVLLESNRQIVVIKLKTALRNNTWLSKGLGSVLTELKIKEKEVPYFLRPKASKEPDFLETKKKSSTVGNIVGLSYWTTQDDELFSIIPEMRSNSFEEEILSVNSVNILVDLLRKPMILNIDDLDGDLTLLYKFINLANSNSVKGEFVQNHLYVIRQTAIGRLSRLASQHSETISKLVDVFNMSHDKYVKRGILWSLGDIAHSNRQAITFLLNVLETTIEPMLGEDTLQFLERITQTDLLELVVKRLKNYEGPEIESILLQCAQHMKYPDFYLAWK